MREKEKEIKEKGKEGWENETMEDWSYWENPKMQVL